MEQVKYYNPSLEEMKIKCANNRRIIFNTEVDRDEIFKVVYYLDKLVQMDKKLGTKEPIEILIDSYGGEAYSILTLCGKLDTLKRNGYIIKTTLTGVAMSAGSILLVMGTKGHRKAWKYGTCMIHNVLNGFWGELQSLRDNMKETERLWNVLCDIYKENTNLTQEMLDDIVNRRHDWFIDSEKCLELGIVDIIE